MRSHISLKPHNLAIRSADLTSLVPTPHRRASLLTSRAEKNAQYWRSSDQGAFHNHLELLDLQPSDCSPTLGSTFACFNIAQACGSLCCSTFISACIFNISLSFDCSFSVGSS